MIWHRMATILVLGACLSAHASTTVKATVSTPDPAVVGRVLFAHGDAQRLTATGPRPLAAGDTLLAGDRLRTGSSGHLQLRFIDNGFVSLRPGSSLHISDYAIDATDSTRNRVRFQLEQGVGRFVTGQGGEAHRAGFRVNTPLAAIGIRGTDFVVSADAQGTRALVNRGAIVMAPFTTGCALDAFGPCQTALARVLTATQHDRYLDLGPRGAPRLRLRSRGGSDLLPLPTESATPTLPAEAPAAPEASAEPESASPETPSNTPDAAPPLAQGDQLSWGRWSEANDASQRQAGIELVARNEVFALYRGTQPVNLPSSGQFSFTPTYTEAYAVRADGTRLPASIVSPRLSINFAEQTFNTGLIWRHAGSSRVIEATGSIDTRGVMQLNPGSASLTTFYGVLSPEALSAAYIFEDAADLRALGLVRWARRLE